MSVRHSSCAVHLQPSRGTLFILPWIYNFLLDFYLLLLVRWRTLLERTRFHASYSKYPFTTLCARVDVDFPSFHLILFPSAVYLFCGCMTCFSSASTLSLFSVEVAWSPNNERGFQCLLKKDFDHHSRTIFTIFYNHLLMCTYNRGIKCSLNHNTGC